MTIKDLVTPIMIVASKLCPFIFLNFLHKEKFSLSTWITGPKNFVFSKMKEFLKMKPHLKYKTYSRQNEQKTQTVSMPTRSGV